MAYRADKDDVLFLQAVGHKAIGSIPNEIRFIFSHLYLLQLDGPYARFRIGQWP